MAPLGRALEPYAAWATRNRRADSAARAATPVVSWDARRELIRIAPIAAWTDVMWRAYRTQFLMINPLLEDATASIGCVSRAPAERPKTIRELGGGLD